MTAPPNPFARPERQWALRFDAVPQALVGPLEQAFSGLASAVLSFETDAAAKRWKVEFICHAAPEAQDIAQRLAVLEAMAGEAAAPPTVAPLEEKDWLGEVERSFPPLSIGRFFVHGSHYEGAFPAGRIPLLVNAGAAFGSGEHATTGGCLEALDSLAKQRRFFRALDMGCGTAILAMAMAKRWRRPVLAADIDRVSVRVARENCRRNRVGRWVRVEASNGYRHAPVARNGPYDLIVANILARPLMLLAKDLARHLAPGGAAVLSGLLAKQENMVLAAHRAQGLYLKRRIAKNGWHTLILTRA